MKKLIMQLTLTMIVPVSLVHAAGVRVDVFLLGGQSNMAGRGDVSEVPDASVLYNENVMLYHSSSMSSGQPANQWTTLRPASSASGYFGPEIGFGNRIAELYPDRRVALIKHAVGGTDIGADWNPGAHPGDTSHFGPQYATFVETVNSGIASLIAQGYDPVIRGMLWQQGERDARNSAYGPAYDRNLSHFIRRVRAQFDAPNMPFIYGQVLPVPLSGYDYRDQVRHGQLDVDEDSGHISATDGARFVPADDLPMNSDNLHVSAAGQMELGIRFAEATGTVVVANAVDFNADGFVEGKDIGLMFDHWDENDPMYDVAPPPFGDGIVDFQDLLVVSLHLFYEIPPVDLIAYWKFDEADGDVAYNTIGKFDGVLNGAPQWQPDDGMNGGALSFDGTDDYLSTPFVIDPALDSFSVFAWIKGGAPGQVILSQSSGLLTEEEGANWLMADSTDGSLRTDLREPETTGRNASPAGPPLISTVVITDGNWHRIGFVRDADNRVLYVDGIEVARDTTADLEFSEGGLTIGAASTLELSSFFSGLIDDVRIYDKALSAQEITALTK
ncbi:MAG: hypothetical protein JXM79_19765 [Sedimentisphaerales bacterium]|nr:hypothetical protein [Sedimentisphaerales bacterium]